jgi:hypothetical protein
MMKPRISSRRHGGDVKRLLLGALVLALAATAWAQPRMEPPVSVRVSHLPHHVRERVQAHADQGITSLARYLEVTRPVHQLRLMDVLAGYDRSSFVVGGGELTDRQVEEGFREGTLRPRGKMQR